MTQDVIGFIDAEIARLEQAKATLARFLSAAPSKAKAMPVKIRAKSGGTEAVVLAVMREGADTLAEITKAAKVKPNAARTAVLALEQFGKVTREGKGSKTRYRVAK